MRPLISIVAAFDQKNGVGINNTLPWKISKDLIRFNSITSGFPIVMGRKTFESLGKPLPTRTNIVLTRDKEWALKIKKDFPEMSVLFSWDDVLLWIDEHKPERLSVIGGPQIWELALPYVNQVLITEVKGIHDCDAFFPEINFNKDWIKAQNIEYPEMTFVNYLSNKFEEEKIINGNSFEYIKITDLADNNTAKSLSEQERILFAKIKKTAFNEIETIKSKALLNKKDIVFIADLIDDNDKELQKTWFKERFPMYGKKIY